jgi:antitoxin component of MazEF toxin-antitoxin module
MDDSVKVNVSDRQIFVTGPARPKHDLAELVARIPKGYQAIEVDFGPPAGKEAW